MIQIINKIGVVTNQIKRNINTNDIAK